MENKEQGYIKKTITMIISTRVGDKWKNTDYCDFVEAKDDYLIVEEKDMGFGYKSLSDSSVLPGNTALGGRALRQPLEEIERKINHFIP